MKLYLLVATLTLASAIISLYITLKYNLGIYICLLVYAIACYLGYVRTGTTDRISTGQGRQIHVLNSLVYITCALCILSVVFGVYVNAVFYKTGRNDVIGFYAGNLAALLFLVELFVCRRYISKRHVNQASAAKSPDNKDLH